MDVINQTNFHYLCANIDVSATILRYYLNYNHGFNVSSKSESVEIRLFVNTHALVLALDSLGCYHFLNLFNFYSSMQEWEVTEPFSSIHVWVSVPNSPSCCYCSHKSTFQVPCLRTPSYLRHHHVLDHHSSYHLRFHSLLYCWDRLIGYDKLVGLSIWGRQDHR